MNSTVTIELLKLNVNNVDSILFYYCGALVLALLVTVGGLVYKIYFGDFYEIVPFVILSVIGAIFLISAVINIFTPLSLTKKTEIKTEKMKILRIEDNLAGSDQLKLLVESKDGKIFTKNVNVNDKNSTIKIRSGDESYTEKITQITYSTKQKVNAAFKDMPKNESHKQVTVYLRSNQFD